MSAPTIPQVTPEMVKAAFAVFDERGYLDQFHQMYPASFEDVIRSALETALRTQHAALQAQTPPGA
jgi:hypothetical protein